MQILATGEVKTHFNERDYIKQTLKALSDKLAYFNETMDTFSDTIVITELLLCKSIIEIVLQNLVTYAN